MNLDKASVLLDKINTLMKSMMIAPAQVASIEKDLMRSYIRQLYEAFLETEQAPAETPDSSRDTIEIFKPRVQAPPPKTKHQEPPPVPSPDPVEPSPQPVEAPPREKKRTPPPLIEIPPAIEEEMKAQKAADIQPTKAVQDQATEPDIKSSEPTGSDELESLFEFPEARELSEKLGQSPISDLHRAISLNERIFTINELFGGDKDRFTEVVERLNQFSDFHQARDYLSREIAEKYGWLDKSKMKKAKEFIKLVRRRYLK